MKWHRSNTHLDGCDEEVNYRIRERHLHSARHVLRTRQVLELLMVDTGPAWADPLASTLPPHRLTPSSQAALPSQVSHPGKTSGKSPSSCPERTFPFFLFRENVTVVSSSRKSSQTRPDALPKLSEHHAPSLTAFSERVFPVECCLSLSFQSRGQ